MTDTVGEFAMSDKRGGVARYGLRQAEVEDFDRTIRRDLDVGRLQIAMDDASLVRGVEGERQLTGDFDRLALLAAGPVRSDPRASAPRRAP